MGELVALALSKRRRINMRLSETLLSPLDTSVAKYLAGALLPSSRYSSGPMSINQALQK